MTGLQIHRPWWIEPERCCHRRRPGTVEPGVLPQRSADEWPANTPPMMDRARAMLAQKAPRYRGARGPITKISWGMVCKYTAPDGESKYCPATEGPQVQGSQGSCHKDQLMNGLQIRHPHCKKSCRSSSTPASGDAGPIHTGIEKSFRHP